jgi:peptide/nickel transport system permease protein
VLGFICRRIIALIPVALGVVIFVALMTRLVPGDPVDVILGDFATLEEKTALRHSLGLDVPVVEQLWTYARHVAKGDLGRSIVYNRPVLDMIGERIGATFELALTALAIALAISLPLGIVSALRKDTWIDYLAMGFAITGVALPGFWLGPMLVLLFSLKLDLLPVSERGDWTSYILPALTMGTVLAAALARMTRNAMLDTMREDYVRTARAKGAGEARVILIHVLRNAALPLVTVLGLQFGVLLTGAIITEKIFDWPGIGSLVLEGILQRDYPVVEGCVLMFSFSYLAVNLLTDILYAVVDPRIKLES